MRIGVVWPKAIFTEDLRHHRAGEYGLRPKTWWLNQSSWGVTPGYGDKWPSAKTTFERDLKGAIFNNDLSIQT